MSDLKPCPICGNSEIKHTKLLNEDTRPSLNTVDVIIDCQECGCSMTRHHLASDTAAHNDVVNEWNRRESYHLIKGELAPCPFCASADLTQRFVSIVSQQMTSAANALIGCKSCACEFCVIGLEETAGYKGAFIAEWNKRHGKKFSAEPIKARQPKALPVTADQLALFA